MAVQYRTMPQQLMKGLVVCSQIRPGHLRRLAPPDEAALGLRFLLHGLDVQAAVQAFLTKLLTVQLPGLIVLPKRLDINIPPAVTAVAEAAVGRDAVMRAVASAVLQVSQHRQLAGRLCPLSAVHQWTRGTPWPQAGQLEGQLCLLSAAYQ